MSTTKNSGSRAHKRTQSSPRTEWDLSILYASPKDPKIARDMKALKDTCARFYKKWHRSFAGEPTEKELLAALHEFANILPMVTYPHPLCHLELERTRNSLDATISAKLQAITTEATHAFNQLLFFELTLGRFSKAKQRALLANPAFKDFHYYLKTVFQEGAHQLSEAEEKIINLKAQPARYQWVNGVSKALSQLTITHKGKELPLEEALGKLASVSHKERQTIDSKGIAEVKKVADFAEAELNALYLDKSVMDTLRGYKKPYSKTVQQYHNNEKSIEVLVDTVTAANPIAHEFYKLKRDLMGVSHMTYADRAASIGSLKQKFDFATSVELVRESLYETKEVYGEIFDRLVREGRIDAFPKKGKQGGAFHFGGLEVPSLIFLNHTDQIRDAFTLAHETGHALHTERSKQQPYLYQRYTISAAETASTFFEAIFAKKVFAKLTEEEKVIALHDRLSDTVATVFRQIAFFRFELALHEMIREKGGASKEEMAALMNEHVGAYMGPAVKLTPDDGYFFIRIPHIRNHFYVYSYTYGHLISRALFDRYQKDPSYIEKVDSFLSAGGSASPDDIFKSIGINTTRPEVFIAGLDSIKAEVKELGKLVQATTRISKKK